VINCTEEEGVCKQAVAAPASREVPDDAGAITAGRHTLIVTVRDRKAAGGTGSSSRRLSTCRYNAINVSILRRTLPGVNPSTVYVKMGGGQAEVGHCHCLIPLHKERQHRTSLRCCHSNGCMLSSANTQVVYCSCVPHVLDLTMTALMGPLWSFMLASMSCDCLPILHMRTMPGRHSVTESHGKHMQPHLDKMPPGGGCNTLRQCHPG